MARLSPRQFGSVTQEAWAEMRDTTKEGEEARFVEHVPTHVLAGMQHPGVPVEKLYEQEKGYLENLGGSLQRHGVKNPITVGYDPVSRRAHITDGMHRLAYAMDQGVEHLPVRVHRYSGAIGGVSVPGHRGEGHVPSDLRPSQIGLPTVP